MDWYELNERFRKFDQLCESLCREFKINLNNDQAQSNTIKIDISTHKQNNLLSYCLLMPNQLRPISYTNITNQLIEELLKDEWFKSTGSLLRTMEKGVLHPVLHYSTIHYKNKNNEYDLIELFRSNKFGSTYTLYQAIYEELYTMELPVVTRKEEISKNSSTILNGESQMKNTLCTRKLKNSAFNNEFCEEKSTQFDYLSVDYSSTDSGCVSLNSTTNDYVSLDEEMKHTKNTSMESLDLSNDSVLNSIQQATFKRDDYSHTDVLTQCRVATSQPITNRLLANNQLNYNCINNGHLIIGFRIRDAFFGRVFEAGWQDMTGARFLSSLIAAKFGLRKIRFLKRIALNTRRQDREYDDGTTFVYILHAEFENLTNRNEIYLTNFVHRLRLRTATLGSISFYTDVLAKD